jgi:hypothetical protein
MFAVGHFSTAAVSKYTNITPMLSDVQSTGAGGTYSSAPTAGPAHANRWIVGWMSIPTTFTTMTIGGVTATTTALSGASTQFMFYANVPTGTAPTIAVSGMSFNNIFFLVATSVQSATTPTLSMWSNTGLAAQPLTATIPSTGFGVPFAYAYSTTTYPTYSSITGNYAQTTSSTLLFGGNYYTFDGAQSNAGATGSQSCTFNFTGATGVFGNVLYLS